MNVEDLFGSFLSRLNQRLMAFPETSDATTLPAADPDQSYLLYLHVPYCMSLCPFCSFHRVRFDHDSATGYFKSLRHEVRLHEDLGYHFDELYVGGGTPTVLPAELFRTISEVRERHAITSVSVETNPDHLRPDSLQLLQDAGVNRLSVGVQSFDDELLQAMHRYEAYGSGAETAQRLKQASGRFDTLNVDMIFNLPQQTAVSLRRDLDILLDDVGADQVSFYPLMASETTRALMSRTMGAPGSTHERKFYEMIVERMLSAGYQRASAWCFSRAAGMLDEYIIDHDEYVGLGSGAFSYVGGSLYASAFAIQQYVRMVESGSSGTVNRRVLSERDQMRYYLLMRLFGGSLHKNQAEAHFNGKFQQKLWPELAALKSVGAIRHKGEALQLTERGYYLWVILMREFFGGINTLREQVRRDTVQEQPALRARE
ncbi:MAG: coproporphyrinogen III oxidase family protein [Gammaproteobacteria bacterium]|nr:coproporphyrinogen III oxidase family protein [Gammaproteobacteria bacterium]MDH5304250.1 coproporphyrinogen III oxidase family protein [Gammaproteobacteria bacterium]MDH5321443.1 coproporphyrinogen III oxidase family protein [Gammaproteobacteria bacterium]